ncbi:TetR/AcrR family transcriptional regulator [Streptomyces sp. NBC_00083]|uniref:TetR/AcrR family transcriptional regulator n=1 Tax=Streptomyces sp. NBC_00083 TaxID=2975647 RepID=UPI002253B285|nr:TetR/AcrR family transcriptional regulator C-terminal domain-containing protein [Streptomyces sp. NBC_00083]MCX5384557.1 TetR/AcrR family transcriptional regulator C-terminal domain-containing protein [Streptomyces sp. NBC_00083]
MTPNPQPRSRRERPAKPALTRDGIIGTAVRIMEAEGLQKLTMRRLAQELDTGPASLYVYVANTAELHAAILEALLGEVDLVAAAATGNWRERVKAVLASYIEVLYAYPGLAQSALIARPSGPHYLDLVEALLALLDEGGVPAGQAAWGVDALLQTATATAAEHSGRRQSAGAEDDWKALAAGLDQASPARHPHVAALGADLISGPPTARRDWILQALVNGIAHTPRPR